MTSVLRLGHRPERDKRMTTHVGLTARAFGINEMYMPKVDDRVKNTLEDVTERFGGDFTLKESKDWRKLIERWEGDVIHLTMYGEDIDTFFKKYEIENPLIIIGAEKVPKDVYDLSDYNVSVGNQPHSEVAALSVFLDRFNDRKITSIYSEKISVLPSKDNKRVINYDNIPKADECYEFMKEKGMNDDLISHSLSVLQRTLEIQKEWGGDLRLLIAGALLHDIGRVVTHDVKHGVEGGRLIRENGWDEELAMIAERHVGGGISNEEAKKQNLPNKNFLPETLEEKIICHADNTVGGKDIFKDLVNSTLEAGYKNSANRIIELAEEFNYDVPDIDME